MNKIEEIVYSLPEQVQSEVLNIAGKSDDCCTVYCDSIGAIGDYIYQLQVALTKITDYYDCGFIEKSHIEEIKSLL